MRVVTNLIGVSALFVDDTLPQDDYPLYFRRLLSRIPLGGGLA
jgi:hypothetical protein